MKIYKNIKNEKVTFSLIREFFQDQQTHWKLLKQNIKKLDLVEKKQICIDGENYIVQNNPERIVSSNAKVDDESIKSRNCFLCEENLPKEQEAIKLKNDFYILCNPYPVTLFHLTIISKIHRPQRIEESIVDFVNLVNELDENFVSFYNGPKCGASAPDHLHFQAVPKKYMPITKNIISNNDLIHKNINIANSNSEKKIIVKSESIEELIKNISEMIILIRQIDKSEIEPKLNLIAFKHNNKFYCIIYPRKKHRPDLFFSEANKFMWSPASLDMGRLIVLPLKKDFEKCNIELMTDLFKEVIWDETNFLELKNKIIQYF